MARRYEDNKKEQKTSKAASSIIFKLFKKTLNWYGILNRVEVVASIKRQLDSWHAATL
jgi:hypothetical protein